MTEPQDLKGLRILYVGPAFGTSLHRMRALQRLGCDVKQIDPSDWLPWRRGSSKLLHETGASFFDRLTASALARWLGREQFGLAFVNGGELIGPCGVKVLRSHAERVVNYCNDNAFTPYTKRKWRLYEKALPCYDLVVVTHAAAVAPARAAGADEVIRVFFAADEIAHAQRALTLTLSPLDHASEVAFIGTWMPERGPFMAELVERGVPLSIWGDRWQKAPEWRSLRASWRGPGVYRDDEYAAAVSGGKVCVGLVSNVTGDLHTTRSIEIPSLGSLLCGQRTAEHQLMYEDGKEAVFWDDAKECAEQCAMLLADDELRRTIARAGHERCLRNGYFNEPILAQILQRALELPKSSNSPSVT